MKGSSNQKTNNFSMNNNISIARNNNNGNNNMSNPGSAGLQLAINLPNNTKTLAQNLMKVTDPKHVPKDFRDQFIKKLQFCSNPLDFQDEHRQQKEKAERLSYFQELAEILNEQNCVICLIIPHLEQVMSMIEKNLFRPLPVLKKAGPPGELGMEEEEVLIDPSWTHLQPVYEFFLQLIVNEAADVKSLKNFISHSFIQEFLELFDSEEPREREYLKNILHRLYAKLVPRRKMIRKAITDTFYTLIHENYQFNGASELLDILASIISGFAIPLRDEHISFFRGVIIPLHKVQTCHLYHEPLLRCSMLFLSKDPHLALYLVEGLLRYWPFANSPKEVMFLTELLEVLEVCELAKLDANIVTKLFKRLIKCIAGPQLQVADRTMCFFENDAFLSILKSFKQVTFPLLVPVIVSISENHWHKVLQESLNALKNILKEIDFQAFEKALEKKDIKCIYLTQDQKIIQPERKKMEDKWKSLTKQAQLKNSSFKEPIVPYTDIHIVGNFNGLNNGNMSNI